MTLHAHSFRVLAADAIGLIGLAALAVACRVLADALPAERVLYADDLIREWERLR